MSSKLLAFLLVVSLFANAYFVLFEEQPSLGEEQVKEMQARIDSLETENENLKGQVEQNNKSLQSYASQLEYYRERIFELESSSQTCPAGIEGFATLQGPAVFQKVELERSGPFIRENISEEGALLEISVEIRPGKGRVLVQTVPLTGVGFQDAANTAVFVAESETGNPLSSSDVIFSVTAEEDVPGGVDGPSAGALMALLTISAVDNSTRLNDSITLTGTIDSEGSIGEIGGVVEKAEAAKAGGKTLFLVPRENSELVTYKLVERNFGGFIITEREPEIVDAEEYIEEEVGIDIEYVDTIDDVLRYQR
ncbi:ATP-dependent protease [Methanosarcina sp. MSH10X1]|uniref:S16 family serine protease n=1 Tax=Methanosarcina sp. MSH10X1 TaxID=2507075 RepID=UPI000FFBB0A4|nr:S16 family serine protease [Methanosarcina sp. MSH10X1]RXA20472.1 ATP-dependent protease [Methanosarcina sp. MSH10X1]